MIIATILCLTQVSPVRSQTVRSQINPLNGLFTPNSSELFFEAGRKQLEQEIERLQMPTKPSDELLQIEKTVVPLQSAQAWCVDSEGHIILTGSSQSPVIPKKADSVIPRCHQFY